MKRRTGWIAGVAATVAAGLVVWIAQPSAPRSPAAPPSPTVSGVPTGASAVPGSVPPGSVPPGPGTTGPALAADPGAVPPVVPTAGATAAAGADGEDDPLGRTDPPPDGVPDQIDIFIGGDDGCPAEIPPGPPSIATVDRPVQPPVEVGACMVNFGPGAAVRVTLTPPAGPVRTSVLQPTGDGLFPTTFLLSPDDPTGTYRVTAEQGATTARAEITVVAPTEPTLLLYTAGNRDVPGVDLHLYLGGFAPGPATVHVFGSARNQVRQPYRTSFTVRVDARGTAHVVVPTSAAGCFGFTTDAIRTCLPDGPCPIVDMCLTRE